MAGTRYTNPEFELRGFNHLALVCRDMQETVDFYTGVLGMKLVKTLEYANGGQHFFFDMGNGRDGIAFFWFPDAPEGIPGISRHPGYDDAMQRTGNSVMAQGTMHHLAFDVAPEKIDTYLVKLREKGIQVTEIVNHATSLHGGHKADWEPHRDDGDVFVRSLYFKDPNGIVLEFATWTTTFDASDVAHQPKTAADLVAAQETVTV
jgi:catechol 2,3-dioxygenase-like lactoylglutathione lyase family enzyme